MSNICFWEVSLRFNRCRFNVLPSVNIWQILNAEIITPIACQESKWFVKVNCNAMDLLVNWMYVVQQERIFVLDSQWPLRKQLDAPLAKIKCISNCIWDLNVFNRNMLFDNFSLHSKFPIDSAFKFVNDEHQTRISLDNSQATSDSWKQYDITALKTTSPNFQNLI